MKRSVIACDDICFEIKNYIAEAGSGGGALHSGIARFFKPRGNSYGIHNNVVPFYSSNGKLSFCREPMLRYCQSDPHDDDILFAERTKAGKDKTKIIDMSLSNLGLYWQAMFGEKGNRCFNLGNIEMEKKPFEEKSIDSIAGKLILGYFGDSSSIGKIYEMDVNFRIYPSAIERISRKEAKKMNSFYGNADIPSSNGRIKKIKRLD